MFSFFRRQKKDDKKNNQSTKSVEVKATKTSNPKDKVDISNSDSFAQGITVIPLRDEGAKNVARNNSVGNDAVLSKNKTHFEVTPNPKAHVAENYNQKILDLKTLNKSQPVSHELVRNEASNILTICTEASAGNLSLESETDTRSREHFGTAPNSSIDCFRNCNRIDVTRSERTGGGGITSGPKPEKEPIRYKCTKETKESGMVKMPKGSIPLKTLLLGKSYHCAQNTIPAELKVPEVKIPSIVVTQCSESESEGEEHQHEDGQEKERQEKEEPIGKQEKEEPIVCQLRESYEKVDSPHFASLTAEEHFSDASDAEPEMSNEERNVVHQESKYQEQIKRLKCEVEAREKENSVLREKVNDLETKLLERPASEDSCDDETELIKNQNSELQNIVTDLKDKIHSLKNDLDIAQREKEKVELERINFLQEKEKEIEIARKALEELENEKKAAEFRFREEYEKLRTVNTDREQHLLDDFEWKLREVEQTCKRKLEEKEKITEEQKNEIKAQLEKQIQQLNDDIKQLDKMKSSNEAELVQLRGLTEEQQRSLRITTRTMEQLQMNEQNLNEDISRLRSSLEKERTHLTTVQGIHSREIAEKDRKHQFKLEQQRNEINAEWEDKLRRELSRLRLDLEKSHREEKRTILDESKARFEKELKESNREWEKKLSESRKEVEAIQQKLANKEEGYREQLLRMQTNSDRDMLGLRRKIDKLDMSYQEKLEHKDEEHEKQLERIKEEHEERIKQIEQDWSQQMEATLHMVKEQLKHETETKIETLNKKHEEELSEQYEKFLEEKKHEVSQLEELHSKEIQELESNLQQEIETTRMRENELCDTLNKTSNDLEEKTVLVQRLEAIIQSLRNENTSLSTRILDLSNSKNQLVSSLKNRQCDDNGFNFGEHYENEIQEWNDGQLNTEHSTSLQKLSDNSLKSKESCSSRSSRRRGKGRHKGGARNGHIRHLNKQLSSSSL